ncbi:hypothetical protein GCM10023322_65140 [Rugosimonospora acidiphila]|uniref:DUF916 domain-containing protein n=1 Tax=Rugosimonospora acidiphila TaxID=556531 RepID=A0ABP9SJG7_9ACTN
MVVNNTAERRHLDLYPASATIAQGQFVFGAGRAANELTSWITLDRGAVDLDPNGEVEVTVDLRVPANAPTGEQYAVVWASTTSDTNPANAVTQINRVGVRVYLDVGPGGEPRSDFSIGKITPARGPQGQPSLFVNVANTGGRALDMSGSVTLSDGPAGVRAGPFEVVKGTTLAPKQSGNVTVRFPTDLPDGPWKAVISLESGLVKHSATERITFPSPGHHGSAHALLSGLTGPWGLLGIALVGGLLIVGVLAVLVRRRGRIGPSQ